MFLSFVIICICVCVCTQYTKGPEEDIRTRIPGNLEGMGAGNPPESPRRAGCALN